MINERFTTYFRGAYFEDKDAEFEDFLRAVEKPISKTLRIKPGKIDAVRNRLEQDGYILKRTPLSHVFEIDRREDFDPFERRLGYSLDHLVGNFYIQELAAAHPVDILAESCIHDESFLILDMASSPGGKTTQLAEYYPNSFIIANEPTRERIPQLLQNLDRMGSLNIWVTLYPGQYFAREAEVFDRILLDAPCSGEGTAFRWGEVLSNWHLKSAKKMAHLQEKLLESALIALKVWGEMVYSTCTLNAFEDEWVIETILEKYPGTMEILFQKKWWPHIDGTGGFFVTKIRKIAPILLKKSSLPSKGNIEIQKMKHTENLPHRDRSGRTVRYYTFRDKILSTIDHPSIDTLRQDYFFMRLGEEVGRMNPEIELLSFAGRDLDLHLEVVEIEEELLLDQYLRWGKIEYNIPDSNVLIVSGWMILGSDQIQKWLIMNQFPKDWRRR